MPPIFYFAPGCNISLSTLNHLEFYSIVVEAKCLLSTTLLSHPLGTQHDQPLPVSLPYQIGQIPPCHQRPGFMAIGRTDFDVYYRCTDRKGASERICRQFERNKVEAEEKKWRRSRKRMRSMCRDLKRCDSKWTNGRHWCITVAKFLWKTDRRETIVLLYRLCRDFIAFLLLLEELSGSDPRYEDFEERV